MSILKKNIVIIILSLFLISSACAIELSDSYKIVESFFVSLGNGTASCEGTTQNECNQATIFFRVPTVVPEQKFKVSVKGECFTNPPNSTEIWNVTVFCSDDKIYNIDLKDISCGNPEPYTFYVDTDSTSYFIYNDKMFTNFWCAFKRNPSNLERLPTEFTVYIESLTLSTKSITSYRNKTLQSFNNISNHINDFVELNIKVWVLIRIIVEIIAILFAIYIVIVIVPTIFNWLLKVISG